jgi:hypothetical protein
MQDEEWLRACQQRGKELIESGRMNSESQVDWFDMERYRDTERDRCERHGCCSKCGESELITQANGNVVCRRTNRQCAGLIASIYERVFE